MKNYFYKVIYEHKNKQFTEVMEAGNPGTAFALCLKQHPNCKLIKAFIEDRRGRNYGFIEHLPPPVQRPPEKRVYPARALRKKEKGCEFSFYDQVQNQEGAR